MSEESRSVRLRIFGVVAMCLFAAMFARLWYLQVLEREELQLEALGNVVESVYEQAPRGRILDRDGRVLVDNKVVQVVTIDPRVLADELDADEREEMYLRLAVAVSRSGRLTKLDAVEDEVLDPEYGPFDDIPVAVDVDPQLLVFIGERPDEFPGVEVVQQTVRSYPFGNLAAHLLGYVGPITLDEFEAANTSIDPTEPEAKTYQLSDDVGKTGIERIFEDQLRGVPGERRYVVNDVGRIIDELPGRQAIPGNDVWLTIDIDVQALAERELADGLDRARDQRAKAGEAAFEAAAGSVVAIDPRDGGVVAMASFPTYDPAEFVNGISTRQFEQLTAEENYSPILNRAIQGTYAPGSTFKLVTSVAAMEQGIIGPSPPGLIEVDGGYLDTGTYLLPGCDEESGTCEFTSPYSGGGRSVTLRDALVVSSDTYYYRIGGEGFFRLPRPEDEGIQATARAMGLGTSSGVQLPYERAGVVPDREYFDEQYAAGVFLRDGDQWYAGDTINLSIGQGDLLVTPLQLANVYATFGNGGRLHQPNIAAKVTAADGTVVREFGPRVLRDLEIPAEITDPILDGLNGVTRTGAIYNGTASEAFGDVGFPLDRWPVAGKTGTAERDGKADTSLFAAFGPADYPGLGIDVPGEPELAVAVVMEEAGFGSVAAAPVSARIMEPVATGAVPRARTTDEVSALIADAALDAAGDPDAEGSVGDEGAADGEAES